MIRVIKRREKIKKKIKREDYYQVLFDFDEMSMIFVLFCELGAKRKASLCPPSLWLGTPLLLLFTLDGNTQVPETQVFIKRKKKVPETQVAEPLQVTCT